MRVAITADLHLTSRKTHPERSNALADILQQCKQEKIELLIVAGDLFDSQISNYTEFEAICRASDFRDVHLLVIPGNHDVNLSHKQVAAQNVRIFDSPTLIDLGDNWQACFVPYRDGQTMGKAIGDLVDPIKGMRWSLVGHGDWLDNVEPVNPYENAKIYMPLTRRELERFNPTNTFLGHIHVPYGSGNVRYAGSPCPVATNETGYRRYLILDTQTGEISDRRVNSDLLYFNANLTILPGRQEREWLLAQIEECKQAWGISPEDIGKARIRVQAVGYSNDRSGILEVVKDGLQEFNLVAEPDISQVEVADDFDRNFVIQQFQRALEEIDYPVESKDEPDRQQILLKAMKLVYGRN